MSFLKKLFKRDAGASPHEPPGDPAQDPNMIRVFDSYGRELFISKEEWRRNVLPGSVRENWHKPDALYHIIFGALHDGVRSDVADAAKHLYQMDPAESRHACIWRVILMEENRLDEAEKVFRGFIAQHGEDGF